MPNEELCKTCQSPMTVAKNKNGGFYATCPNKANHGTGKKDAPPTPVVKEKKPPADAPKPTSQRTVFGW
jgi:hypothetical protein